MIRLLLISMLAKVYKLLPKIEPDLKNKRITYIPTAGKAEKLGFLLKIDKQILKSLGLIIDELDVSISSYNTIKDTLCKNDLIFVTGGNTFYLLQELKKNDIYKLVTEQVNKGKLYIGESAGAIITAPNIEYSALMDNPQKAPLLNDYTGLSLVDFYVVPHCRNLLFNKAVKKITNKYQNSLNLKIITDRQAIFVKDQQLSILDIKSL